MRFFSERAILCFAGLCCGSQDGVAAVMEVEGEVKGGGLSCVDEDDKVML